MTKKESCHAVPLSAKQPLVSATMDSSPNMAQHDMVLSNRQFLPPCHAVPLSVKQPLVSATLDSSPEEGSA